MRIARLSTPNGPQYAVAANGAWNYTSDPFAGALTRTGGGEPFEGATLLAPCEPRVVVGMAHNAMPGGAGLPTQAFLKSARTVVGPGGAIGVDTSLGRTEVEGELAVVIGRPARHLTEHNALEHVLGFTIGNDVTEPEQLAGDELLTQAKQGDGHTPLGPWIETEFSTPDAVGISVYLDDTLRASGTTAGLLRGVVDQLVYVTRYMSLGPGDVVLGGCPGAAAAVGPAERVRIEIDGIGALQNPLSQHRAHGGTR